MFVPPAICTVSSLLIGSSVESSAAILNLYVPARLGLSVRSLYEPVVATVAKATLVAAVTKPFAFTVTLLNVPTLEFTVSSVSVIVLAPPATTPPVLPLISPSNVKFGLLDKSL